MARADDPKRGKVDDDDHDLLTFREAGERLKLEIAQAERAIASLEESGDNATATKAAARLQALREAAQRNSAQPINDDNFEKFFGYAGRARRNLPGRPPSG